MTQRTFLRDASSVDVPSLVQCVCHVAPTSAVTSSAFSDHVGGIHRLSAKAEMLNVEARRIVAGMQEDETFWYWPVDYLPGDMGDPLSLAEHPDDSIAMIVAVPSPDYAVALCGAMECEPWLNGGIEASPFSPRRDVVRVSEAPHSLVMLNAEAMRLSWLLTVGDAAVGDALARLPALLSAALAALAKPIWADVGVLRSKWMALLARFHRLIIHQMMYVVLLPGTQDEA